MRSAVLLLIALTHLAQASIACVGRHAKHSDSRSDYRNLTRRSATSQRCTDRPQIIDYQCRQGYPSSLTMTIEVPTDGQNDCTVSLFRESDIISTFVYKPETDGKQTISVPSEYMLSSITGYNGGNDIGQAPRDIICPYERLPVRCVITVTGVRGIKGPNGGFFSLVSGSIQPGCGPLSYYIEGDLADYGMADDFDFQSTKELPAGDYTITVYNNPADEAEFDVAEPVDFRFSLGGPETSLRRRRLECNLDEELCYDARGRLRCYADLDSNLGRCGSCDGPDCTKLPNVKGALCTLGLCVVDLCAKGYHLKDNACREVVADKVRVGRFLLQA